MYRFIVELRNFCFDHNILKIHKLSVPVISVGNITAGGTGKTPFTIALCEALKNDYKHIIVLSRGYGRASRGAQVVSVKGELKLDVRNAGDEPYQIAKNCSYISVVVANKRIDAWRLIENEQADLIILDDAFQHRYIHRNIDIVLNNGFDSMENDFLIPYGRLREPLSSLKRASFVCNTKSLIKGSPIKQIDCTKVVYTIEAFKADADIVLITAIANPQEVENALLKLGIKLSEKFIFSDHADFAKKKLPKLEGKHIICTEKDYAKLCPIYKNKKIYQIKIVFNLPYELISEIKRGISDSNQYI